MMLKRLLAVISVLVPFLLISAMIGLCFGPSRYGFGEVLSVFTGGGNSEDIVYSIIRRIRLPRVMMAALIGGALSLGGLVFQALLRNPLAEPYILGISGGSAVGAIIGILMNLSRFPGVCFTAFTGSMAALAAILAISSGRSMLTKDSLLLSGVMLNAFCSAVIMFLISMTQDSRLHNIMFWLMGDLSAPGLREVAILAGLLAGPVVLLFLMSHKMNLLLMGKEMAGTLGVNVKLITLALFVATSYMISATVAFCGLIGFVGLVMPHLLRLVIGPDHRLLAPACLLAGGGYMILCDTLSRTLPKHGEMPVGVVTAIIGAPLFIILLKSARK